MFGTIPVSRLILDSVRETVRPPAWWLSSQKIPVGVNGQEFLNAHEILKTYIDRIQMVKERKKNVCYIQCNRLIFVEGFCRIF